MADDPAAVTVVAVWHSGPAGRPAPNLDESIGKPGAMLVDSLLVPSVALSQPAVEQQTAVLVQLSALDSPCRVRKRRVERVRNDREVAESVQARPARRAGFLECL